MTAPRPGLSRGGFLHFDGKAWSVAQPNTQPLVAIGGSAPDHVWAVGDSGAIVRFINGRYEDRRAGSITDLNKIFGFSESEVWAVGKSGTVLRRRPTEWERIELPTQGNLLAISGTSANDLWVVGEAGASLHFDGKSWSNVPSGTRDPLFSIWSSGPSDAWAGGPQLSFHTFLHWDGAAWSDWTEHPPGTVLGFWGFAPDDLWAVGFVCDYLEPFNPLCIKTASHFDGSSWTAQYPAPPVRDSFERLVAIWGIDSRDVWVLAWHNAVYHWDGEHWSPVEFPEIYACTGLWGRAKDDVFATCGSSVVHWNGDGWSVLPTVNAQRLSALWEAHSQFWVVGEGGAILRHSESPEQLLPKPRITD